MKYTRMIVIALALMVVAQGCIVKSLHPFFDEPDVIFKNELLNAWIDQDGQRWKIESVKEKPNAYSMTVTKDGKDAVFIVHLFQLENNLFLDFLPVASDGEPAAIFNLHLLPTHSVAKVDQLDTNEVRIRWFNEDWLTKLFQQNRIKISHEVIFDAIEPKKNDPTYVLTASTEELRKFLLKYANDETAFEGDNSVKMVLKKSI